MLTIMPKVKTYKGCRGGDVTTYWVGQNLKISTPDWMVSQALLPSHILSSLLTAIEKLASTQEQTFINDGETASLKIYKGILGRDPAIHAQGSWAVPDHLGGIELPLSSWRKLLHDAIFNQEFTFSSDSQLLSLADNLLRPRQFAITL
jgi:hypothetical protein